MKRATIAILTLALFWSGTILAADQSRTPANIHEQSRLEGVVKAPDTSLPPQETINRVEQSAPQHSPHGFGVEDDFDQAAIVKQKIENGEPLSISERYIAKEYNLIPDAINRHKGSSLRRVSRTTYLTEGFETAVPPTGWTEYQAVGTNSWAQSSARYNTGSYSAYFNDYSGDNTVWLITSAIDLSSATAPRFSYYDNVNYSTWADGHNVLISSDYTGTGDPGAATWDSLNYTIGTEDTWVQNGPYDLSSYNGSSVYIAFQYIGNFASEWYLDDFLVEETPTDPALVLSADSLGFGVVPPTLSVDEVLTISNTGGATLNISNIVSTDAAFTVDTTSGAVAPDGDLDVMVTFTSSAPTRTDFMGALVITSDAPSSPDTVLLGGDAAPTAGGPDAFGYSWVNSFDAAGPVYGWIDTTDATNSGIAGGDDYRGTIPLPFDFYFYGNWYNEITATTNGWIGMGPYTDYSSSYWTNDTIPYSSAPNNIIAPLWDDWKAGGTSYPEGAIYYKTVGVEPNRQFVVIFHNFYRSSSNTDLYTFECILEEGTNNITVQYLDVVGSSSTANNGVGATVGIEDADGAIGSLFEYNGDPQLVYDSEAVLFVAPEPPSTGLMFSEYIEGSSNNKAIELFNSSLDTLYLDNYQIAQAVNGGGWAYYHAFPVGAMLAPGDVWTILNDAVDPLLFDVANADEVLGYPSVVHHNGDDARAVVMIADGDTTFIDIIGDPDNDPGSGWDVAGVTTATANYTLIRKAEIMMGNTDWAASAGTDSASSEWMVYPQDYFTNLGGHPDDPCWENFTTVTVVAASYGSEKNFMVQDAAGDTLLSCFGCMGSYSTFTESLCLPDGFYTFWAMDGWGDGWDGATFEITDAEGNVIASGSGPTSSDDTNWIVYNFAVGDVPAAYSSMDYFDFGGVTTETGPAMGYVDITNIGGADLNVSSVEVYGDGFASSEASFTVGVLETYSVEVTFDPSDEMDYMGGIVFTHDAESSPDTVELYGFGIDGFFFEGFDPYTGDVEVLPMEGWIILDNNEDADQIPDQYKTWYHDDYGLDGSGNMVAYIGYSNSYHADETLITPMINVPELSVVSFWMFEGFGRGYSLDISYSTDGMTFMPIASKAIPTGYEYFEVLLPDTGDQYIAFTFAPDSGGSYTYLNFDEVLVSPAPPMGALAGTVTDGLGAALEGAEVMVADFMDSTDAAGMYSFDMIPVGQYVVSAYMDGYQPANFTVTLDSAATTTQDFVLLSTSPMEVYSNGFEAGSDPGWTYTGGENPFEVSGGFSYTTPDTTISITPATGDSFLVCTPAAGGYVDNEFSWWMNLTDTDMDLTSYLQAHVSMKLWVMSEQGYDNVRVLANQPSVDGGTYYYLNFDVDNDGNFVNGLSGDTEGWVEINADLSAWVGVPDVELAILFSADGSVSGATDSLGFGVAVDDIMITGSGSPLPEPMHLMATSFMDGQIPLSWDAPMGGARTLETHSITMERYESNNVKNDPRVNALEPTITKVTKSYEIDNGSSRDFQSYNVFKGMPDMGFMLIGNTTDNTFTDMYVENYMPYHYFVTAVYDEGESVPSNMVEAAAGEVTDLTYDMAGTDFEVDLGGLPAGWTNFNMGAVEWTVQDSTSAEDTGGNSPADHTKFAWIDDDAVGSGVPAQTILLSPWMDFSDLSSIAMRFDYVFNDLSTDFAVVARVGYDEWFWLESLPEAYPEWVDSVWVDLSEFAGYEHVRVGFLYDDLGGWDWWAGVDNVHFETFPAPVNLAASATATDITLTWNDPMQQAPQFPEVSELSSALPEIAENAVQDINRVDCFNHAPFTWYYWSWYDSLSGPSSLFSFPEGPMTLDSVFFDVYQRSTCSVNGEEVAMKITLAEADLTGMTVDTIFQTVDYMFSPDGGGAWRWALDISGFEFMSTGDNFLKVMYQPMTFADSINSSLTSGFVPSPLSDDGGQETGFSGWDSAGVFYPTIYNFSQGVCGTPSYPALSYNVYRDDMMIGELVEEQMFVDMDVAVGMEYEYFVSAVLNKPGPNGAMLIESDTSDHIMASPQNTPPTAFNLLSPLDGDTLWLTPDNVGLTTLFAWTPSSDPEGGMITYDISWVLQELTVTHSLDTTGLAVMVSNTDLYDDISLGGLTGVNIEWDVMASDGMDDTPSANGPRSLYVDITAFLGLDDEAAIPDVFALHQNYPNPFNPVTNIAYDVPEISNIEITVYNVMGQKVRTLVNAQHEPGYHNVVWNGTNAHGAPVSSGMYFYQIKADNFHKVKKLILMK